MIYNILNAMGLYEREVQLGVSPQMSKDLRHGVIHYDTKYGVRHIGFLADNPQFLKRADPGCVDQAFRQLDRLGIPAMSIEVKIGRSVRMIARSTASLAASRLRAL